jgi:hypothetical protein
MKLRLALFFISFGIAAWWLVYGCAEDSHQPPTAPTQALAFVDTTYPHNKAVDVPLGAVIYIAFLRPMDEATLTGRRFHLSGDHAYSFSSNENMARIVPNGLLHRSAEYEVVIDSGIADTLGNIMTKPYRFTFKTISGSDFISDLSPGEGQEGVSTRTSVIVTFSRPLDYATVTDSTFYITGVSGDISFDGNKAILRPNDVLNAAQRYTVTLKSSVADTAGTALGLDYIWYFTTGASTEISVVSVYPPDGATNVPRDADISIKFSREIDSTSVTPNEFTVSGGLTGTVSCLGNTVTFNPASDLLPESTYTARFEGTVTSTFGGEGDIDYQWSFTAAAVDTFPPYVVSIFPADGGFAFKEDTITITFSENILPDSISSDEFVVRFSTGGTIGGKVSVSGTTVRFVPDHDFLENQAFTAEFIGDVYDLAGNKADINYTWSFTVTYYSIIERYPAAGCAPLNAHIMIICSGPVDPQTVSPDDFVLSVVDGDTLSGTVAVMGDTITYTPGQLLESLTRYRAAVVGEITDTEGHLLHLQSMYWYFSTKGEDLLPLAIGNKWFYHVSVNAMYPTPIHESHTDSIVIVRDSIVDGKHYYYDQYNRVYRYEDEIIETTFQLPPNFQFKILAFDNNDCENGTVITEVTNIGDFAAQAFSVYFADYYQYDHNQGYHFAPGVGLVGFDGLVRPPCSGCEIYTDWILIGYELQ